MSFRVIVSKPIGGVLVSEFFGSYFSAVHSVEVVAAAERFREASRFMIASRVASVLGITADEVLALRTGTATIEPLDAAVVALRAAEESK